MAHRKKSKRSKSKTILRLPDLEQSKNAVLHSLAAASSQESYGHAIDEFIGWLCLAKTPYAYKMNALAQRSIRIFRRFSP